MAKIVKKKVKRRFRIEGFALFIFMIAIFGVLFSSLIVRVEKNSITMKIEDTKNECASLREQNTQLNIEIQNLISKDRVFEIAENNGLNQNQDNVISVTDGE